MVLNGDALDRQLLEEMSETPKPLSPSQTTMKRTSSPLLAKRQGCQRTITLINKSDYETLISTLGIDVAVPANTVSKSSSMCVGSYSFGSYLREGFGN